MTNTLTTTRIKFLFRPFIPMVLSIKMNSNSTQPLVCNVNQITNGSTNEIQTKTKVIQCSDERSVGLASKQLRIDNVIAIPTDTVYGFACSANSAKAIQKLYAIKGREQTKAVAICVATITDLRRWGEAEHLSDELLSRLLPGAVTIVLQRTKYLDNPYLNSGFSKIAIRIPDFNFIRDVTRDFGHPIALTSANRSADTSTLCVNEFESMWSDLGMVFDGGILGQTNEQRAGSTIVDLSEKGWFSIVRTGVASRRTTDILKQFNIHHKTCE